MMRGASHPSCSFRKLEILKKRFDFEFIIRPLFNMSGEINFNRFARVNSARRLHVTNPGDRGHGPSSWLIFFF